MPEKKKRGPKESGNTEALLVYVSPGIKMWLIMAAKSGGCSMGKLVREILKKAMEVEDEK